ncbi:MAG: alpha/beta fold hydrolase [Candidatus Eisenbacteria bacterium]|nr:alpha/beta fold hydrolase [Candidatus Latescibacterota bacterium]MBD3302026.1 alpha/beta fold hydrolase [Candidatus Eisenbacteria bacterium]
MLTILALLLAAYALLCLLAFAFQSRLVFFPDRELTATPRDAGLDYEDISFLAQDGVRLHGWMIPGPDGGPLVLLLHGNAGNVSHRLGIIRLLHDLGASVFIFDYRGYGRSEGTPSEQGTYRDAEGAWRLLTERENVRPSRIVLFGRSLGSAVAIDLASSRTPAGLILEGSFPSLVAVGRKAYPYLPVGLLARIRYDSARKIPGIGSPKLFLHAQDDDVVPIALGRRLFDAAAEPKEFVIIAGGHEGPGWDPGTHYARSLRAFLDAVRERPKAGPVPTED